MRIIAGSKKGLKLSQPSDDSIRPTADRVRENLFNILSHNLLTKPWPEISMLDIFAGTGAIGCEALSRGCSKAVFIEKSQKARDILSKNIRALGMAEKVEILAKDALNLGCPANNYRFDLVFMDPPYNNNFALNVVNGLITNKWLSDDAIICIEEEKDVEFPPQIDNLLQIHNRVYGRTRLVFYQYNQIQNL